MAVGLRELSRSLKSNYGHSLMLPRYAYIYKVHISGSMYVGNTIALCVSTRSFVFQATNV
jgi:hypothetical protein